MGDTTAAARQERFRARQKAGGKVEMRAWVTPEQARAIRAYLDGAALKPEPVKAKPVKVTIGFSTKPKFEVREALKRLGLRWDGQRWIGQAEDRSAAEQLGRTIRSMGGNVQIEQ